MDAEVEYGEQQMEDDSGFLHPMDSQVSRDAHDQVTNSTRVGVHKVTDLTRVLRFLCVGNENGSYHARQNTELNREMVDSIYR